jgi:hypothetical protein
MSDRTFVEWSNATSRRRGADDDPAVNGGGDRDFDRGALLGDVPRWVGGVPRWPGETDRSAASPSTMRTALARTNTPKRGCLAAASPGADADADADAAAATAPSPTQWK